MKPASTKYQTTLGEFTLRRYPSRSTEALQAWCAADTLLIEAATEHALNGPGLLVANDDFGALALPLQPDASWTDSWLAAEALRRNTEANGQMPSRTLWSTEAPAKGYRAVVMRVPKQLPYFHYQLAAIAAHLPLGSQIIAGGMDKHLSPHTADALEQWIGPTTRHRGRQKARLFSAQLTKERPAEEDASSGAFNCSYYSNALDCNLSALPNVFSGKSLDIGSRFLLSHLSSLEPAGTAIDLACGNGVIGLCALQAGTARQVLFADESAMAIESTRSNVQAVLGGDFQSAAYHLGDGLKNFAGAPVDLILCNPPFHLGHTVDEFAARRLIAQCHTHLLPTGKLCLVANRHLNYLPDLRRYFRHVQILDSNSKFNLFLASAPAPSGNPKTVTS